jgi:hypothetical protein
MDRSRKANRNRNETTLQHRSADDASRIEALAEEQLRQLLADRERLEQTTAGAAELRRRIKAFGECRRLDEEAASLFYDRLRHWLSRPIPATKTPLHRPRQNES